MMMKKGFTLIELIVVIAIIGVLAMILVPTMIGYIRKSKIVSANESAALMYKAINSALVELDTDGIDIGGNFTIKWKKDDKKWTITSASQTMEEDVYANGKFARKVKTFFDDVEKIRYCEAAISGNVCIAITVARDVTYTGTYPSGVIRTENYEYYVPADSLALNSALADAMIIYFGGTPKTGYTETGTKAADERGFKIIYKPNGKSTVEVK